MIHKKGSGDVGRSSKGNRPELGRNKTRERSKQERRDKIRRLEGGPGEKKKKTRPGPHTSA